jgi:uncharacterized protein (TIGR02284 family)
METKEQIIQMLKGLFIICRSSELAYKEAAKILGESTRDFLHSFADQRKEFAEEIQSEIRFHSGSEFHAEPPADSWKEIRQAILKKDQREIIHALERAEEAMLRIYHDGLSKRLPWDVETVLAHQYSDIKKTYYFISALELFSNEQFVV